MNVLITDGEQRAALALVRSLGRAGYAPIVTSTRKRSLAGTSRWATRSAVTPDPLGAPDDFAAAVQRLVHQREIGMVIPVSEPAALALLPARELLAPAIVPFPDEATFRRICDKQAVLEAAARIGLGVPEQTTVRSRDDVGDIDAHALTFPIVVKPSRSVGESGGTREKVGVSYAANAAELMHQMNTLSPAAYPVLLQRRIVGEGTGVFVLTWQGRLLACFGHRRLREKPPSGGVSVYRESAPIDDTLVRLSIELLRQFAWQGVAMVEFKVDEATGKPYLMEINPRFWGSLQLAIDAGVDFPVLLARAARGEPVVPVDTYRIGVKSRWWWGDVDHLLAVLRRRDAHVMNGRYPGRAYAIREFLRIRSGDINEVFRWSDARPFVRETLDWLARR